MRSPQRYAINPPMFISLPVWATDLVITMCSTNMSLLGVVLINVIFHNYYVGAEPGLCGVRASIHCSGSFQGLCQDFNRKLSYRPGGRLYSTGIYTRIRPSVDNKNYICCPGYRESPRSTKIRICLPIPTCKPSCGHGECVKRNTCECNVNYTPQNQTCVQMCKHPCLNGVCTAPDTCQCLSDYKTSSIYLPNFIDEICQPVCNNQCINAICTAPDECECLNGFKKSNKSDNICEPHCNKSCENGLCVYPETCSCNDGWNLDDGGKCQPICMKQCVNATCTSPNNCECHTGYKKPNDIDNICEPICSNTCSHGMCVRPEICVCDKGWYWNNDTKVCETNNISVKNSKNWFSTNWQWMMAAIIILILKATTAIFVFYIKCNKKKDSNDNSHIMMEVPEQDIHMNILRRAKINI